MKGQVSRLLERHPTLAPLALGVPFGVLVGAVVQFVAEQNHLFTGRTVGLMSAGIIWGTLIAIGILASTAAPAFKSQRVRERILVFLYALPFLGLGAMAGLLLGWPLGWAVATFG